MLTKNLKKPIGERIREILIGVPNPTIFELGVHWGEDTRRIMNLCESAPNYHGFEPDPRNIAIIQDRMINTLPYNMTLVEGAVGSKNEVLDFHLSDGNHPTNGNQMTGANSIRPPKDVLKRHAWIKFNKKIKVQCFTLDEYCKNNNIHHIDFMWCDIQGAEYDMILGAMDILSKTKYTTLEFSDVELYEGQKTLNQYMDLLRKTGDWEIVDTYQIDVLIQNKSLLK